MGLRHVRCRSVIMLDWLLTKSDSTQSYTIINYDDNNNRASNNDDYGSALRDHNNTK